MARTSTSWSKGRSGNPKGRPKNPGARQALRQALALVDPESGQSRLDEWAEALVQTNDPQEILAILKFLEGPSPTAGADLGDDEPDARQPRIVIPGSPHDPNA